MKILRANGSLAGVVLMLGAVELLFIWLWLCTAEDVIFLLFPPIIFIPAALWAIMLHATHWIRYGQGKLVIRRVSKMWQSGWPPAVGKWQKREDEFLLEDIEVYGDVLLILGRPLEYPLGGYNVRFGYGTKEILFRLKDGRKVTFILNYFTKKQAEELFRYIRDEGGIEMVKAEGRS